ncbi:hypothetical protein QA597_02490 [Marinilabiliaceae bacterium ANBcel2]|nr:hypothetical protein [Marinilabiliaceae bacterium ANBcel2]
MKKLVPFILIFVCLSFNILAQNAVESINDPHFELHEKKIDSLISDINFLKQLLNTQNSNISNQANRLSRIEEQQSLNKTNIDSLFNNATSIRVGVDNLSHELISKERAINEQIDDNYNTTTGALTGLKQTVSRNTLYWIIAVFAVGLMALLFFVLLRKKLNSSHSSMVEAVKETRKDLEEEALKLDEKLMLLMESQLKTLNEERKGENNKSNPQTQQQDHSLAIKVADEIVRIEKNISQMDANTKGLKQLSKAVERIKDNFASNGYEMVDMIGMDYNEGMKVTANFRPDEKLKPDERVISRIIKPQINYNGVMIQSAQIEVSQGE